VLAGKESVARLLVVQEGRRRDVDELDVWHREHRVRGLHVGQAEARGAGE
jgi:hypothetical protein